MRLLRDDILASVEEEISCQDVSLVGKNLERCQNRECWIGDVYENAGVIHLFGRG